MIKKFLNTKNEFSTIIIFDCIGDINKNLFLDNFKN